MSSYEYQDLCNNHLKEVSRTFALSIQYLPADIQHYTCLSYLLCRIPDTIEDEPSLNPSQKDELLQSYLYNCFHQNTSSEFITHVFSEIPDSVSSKAEYWELIQDTEKVIESYHSTPTEIQDSICQWSTLLTQGMNNFVSRYSEEDGIRIKTVCEFEEYCYYVAGTVGHLLLELISHNYSVDLSPQMYKSSREYGHFLQTINILKDVYDDKESEDNIYIPESVLSQVGLSQETLFDATQDQLTEIIDELLFNQSWSRKNARLFLEWCSNQSPEVYTSYAIPYFLAIATQRELREHPEKSIQVEEVKISKDEVFAITETLEKEQPNPLQFEKRLLDRPLTKIYST